jgi:hypothetical protein
MPITVSGTAITFNDATTQTTAFTGGGGTVTSVATGNGLQGGTITTSGTLSVACPSFNTVGSYCFGMIQLILNASVASGTNYSAGGIGNLLIRSNTLSSSGQALVTNNLSGTWKWMSGPHTNSGNSDVFSGVVCRVS